LEEKDISLLEKAFDRGLVKMVVRHAERPLFKTTKAPQEVSITTNGKEEAKRLGLLLGRHGLMLKGCASSPVRRCVQTAELIAAGNQFCGPVGRSPSLGGSNLFTDDAEAFEHTLDTCTIEEIIGRQLGGDKVPGMRDLEEVLRIFMGGILSDRSKDFELFVSHDLFVCPAVHYLTETPYSAIGNTGFLEGFFISIGSGRTKMLWNSRWYDVTDRMDHLFSRDD
jgi:hypothetical protein